VTSPFVICFTCDKIYELTEDGLLEKELSHSG
jgi:hypothetical protein